MKENLPPLDNDRLTLILEAAQKRFGHYGLAKTTMNDIATDIGLSKASLYYYYPDKVHLFIAVIDKEKDEFVKAIEKIIPEEGLASKKLKQYVTIRHLYFQKLHSIAAVGIQALTEMKSLLEKWKESFSVKDKELILAILQQGVRDGEFESIPAKSHADLFVTTLQGLRTLFIKKGEIATEQDYQKAEHYQKLLLSFFLKAIIKQ